MEQLIKRLKSFAWRAGSLALVTAGAYILQVGDIFSLDTKTLINIIVLAVIGLVVGEVTKFVNSK